MKKRYRAINVKWEDAWSDTGWCLIALPREKPVLCHTRGYLLAKTRKRLVIAPTLSGALTMDPILIPRSMVLGIEYRKEDDIVLDE